MDCEELFIFLIPGSVEAGVICIDGKGHEVDCEEAKGRAEEGGYGGTPAYEIGGY